MRSTIKTLFLTLVTLAFFSCAETKSEEYTVIEQRSLDEWVKLNRAEAKPFGDGMYKTTITEPEEGAEEISDGSWVMLNYIGYDLDGDIYANRYEEVAKRILAASVFSPRTHYTPHLMRVVTDSSMLLSQYEALKTMKVGEEVELIMPSSRAFGEYGSNFGDGYQGNTTIGPNKPAILVMSATVSVRDITAYENKLTLDYAKANLVGIESAADTLASNFYVNINFDNADMIDTIRVDSSFNYNYTVRFLDGFLLDTNDPEIALAEWNTVITGSPLEYTSYSSQIEAFKTIVSTDTLRNGCTFTMVFPSEYGYGYYGQSPETGSDPATVQPYTPLVFEVEVLAKEEEEEEE